jgi:hypothetical protein
VGESPTFVSTSITVVGVNGNRRHICVKAPKGNFESNRRGRRGGRDEEHIQAKLTRERDTYFISSSKVMDCPRIEKS